MDRKGFSLVEVLMVIVILAILASIGFWVMSLLENSRITATEGRVQVLGYEAMIAAKLKGFPPARLEDLAPRLDQPGWIKEGRFVDSWERHLEYQVDGKRFTLLSAGPDGVRGTRDDIVYVRK